MERIPVIDEVINEIERIVSHGCMPLCVHFQRYQEFRRDLIEMEDFESVKYYDGRLLEITSDLNKVEINFN